MFTRQCILSCLFTLAVVSAALAANTNQVNLLCKAAEEGNADQVKALLLENAGLVNEKGGNGFTALHWAAGAGHKAAAEILIAKGG